MTEHLTKTELEKSEDLKSYKKVALVLVNYKDYAKKYLIDCRDSLRQQSYPSEKTKIYIVDNASTAESYEFLEKTYPEAVILSRSDANYVAANNLGTQEAIKAGCEYIVAVNMDTIMTPGWLEELVIALDTNLEAGVAQSKILLDKSVIPDFDSSKNFINTLGNKIHFLGFGSASHYQEEDREIISYPEIRGYASGCSFIFRKEVFLDIGAWNEDYFMYHDDIEFSWKAKLAGYKIILAPKSVIFHKYEFSRSIRMLYYMERNRYLFIFSFYPLGAIILLSPALFFLNIAMLFYSIFSSWFKTHWQVQSFFWKASTWHSIRAIRRKYRPIRKKTWPQLKGGIDGRLDFLEINNILLRLANPILNFYWYLVKSLT